MAEEAKPPRSRWGQGRRLDFIEFRLLWEGRINRGDLTEFFGVSMPQASADLASYVQLAPNNMAYDGSDKVYKATRDFQPVRSKASPQHYFLHLLALHTEGPSQDASFIGFAPPYAGVGAPRRFINPSTLISVLSAIRSKSALEVEYQSLTRPSPTRRWITPTAIVNDEFRWHVRAWCHTRNRYADFLFGRMLHVHDGKPMTENLPADEEWETMVTLVMRPNPHLTEGQRRATELDYDMNEGQFELTCRKALVFYLLRRLRLDDDEQSHTPKARQLVLVNRDAVTAVVGSTSDYLPKQGAGPAQEGGIK